jgi:lysosomal Pro-X carboxypeptidase
MCKAIDNPTTGNDTFEKLYGAANVYYNHSGTATCFNLNDHSDPHDLGGWGWQVQNIYIFSFLFCFFFFFPVNS